MTTQTATAGLQEQGGTDFKKVAVWIASVGIWFLPLLWIDPTTYAVLTVAGLAMGMLIFLTASGLTLIFGLMDVLNLAHGAFFVWGAYVGFSLLGALQKVGWVEGAGAAQSIGSVLLCLLAALVVGGLMGIVLEKMLVRLTYGSHLKQILITMGASLILVEILKVVWSPNDEVVIVPAAFQGSWDIMDVIVTKFRVVAIVVGLAVLGGIQLVMMRTKLGIIVRAGVENKEVVETLGYNIRRVFTGVFCAGAALAAVGGTMWSIFKEQIHPAMGEENLIFALIVVIIGGMGSVTGSFLGAIMVGLAFNYVAYTMPPLALGANIMIMAVILLIRPTGLMGKE
ncbi:MAG: branched-chain amino acid ABC transporter permease [Proteobacteria bacterium]|nr:branched-chain amino acid ABC transporter permease [Pseudomonadota bacterium]